MQSDGARKKIGEQNGAGGEIEKGKWLWEYGRGYVGNKKEI